MWIVLAAMVGATAGQGAPDRTDLQTMFQLMDRNGDGYITANEAPRITQVRTASLQSGASRPGAEWIEGYDRDGDGRVSQNEFVSGAEGEIAQN